ncbi:hypothetical protein K8I61_01970 [bacterium]|nr:hypothetical protein [bacterium]
MSDYKWDDHHDAMVTMRSDGKFAVLWDRLTIDWENPAADRERIVSVRYFESDGSPATDSIVVDTPAPPKFISSAIGSNDDIVVLAWTDGDEGDPKQGVYVRLYDWNGQALGERFAVFAQEGVVARFGSLSVNGDGYFLIEHTIEGQTDKYHLFNSGGDPFGEPFTLETPGVVGMDSQRGFVVAWNDGEGSNYDVYARRYDANHAPVDESVRVSETSNVFPASPVLVVWPAGEFAIAWQTADNPEAANIRVFDMDGNPRTGEFSLSASGDQIDRFPSLDSALDGRFAAAWLRGALRDDVRFRRFETDATPSGDDISVFSFEPATSPKLGFPSVAMGDDGSSVVAVAASISGYPFQVIARLIDANGNLVCPEL